MIRIENRQPKAKRGYFAKFLNFKVAFYTKETTYVRIFFKFEHDNRNDTIQKEEIEKKIVNLIIH